MKSFRSILLIALALITMSVRAEVVVIVHAENELDSLSKDQVIGLFMGRNNAFPNGLNALPFDQDAKSGLRENFYQKLTKKSSAQINAYWARLIFSGRATPPEALDSDQDIISTVRNNPNAIAYVDSQFIDHSVKVVYRFK